MPGRRTPDDLKEVIRDYRRDQVVEVARQLFGQRGTIDVPMDEIATAAGVARSTIYVYFANREELLRACLKGMHTQLLEAVAEAWETETGPEERLRLLIEAMLAQVDESPAFFRLAMVTQGTPASGAEAVSSELALISLDMARLLRGLYEDGATLGRFRVIDPDVAVSLIGQHIYGAIAVRAAEPVPGSRATAAEAAADFILYGLVASS